MNETMERIRNGYRAVMVINPQAWVHFRGFIVFFIVIDLFLVYWYLNAHSLAVSIFIILLILLCFAMVMEQRGKLPDIPSLDEVKEHEKKI